MITELTKQNIRPEVDQMTNRFIRGIEDRSHYALNEGIYAEIFPDGRGLTWFKARIFDDLGLDYKFGRGDDEDQKPLFFNRDKLPEAVVKDFPHQKGLVPITINLDAEIEELYRNAIRQQCPPGEDRSKYGETAKLDSYNISNLGDRVYKTAVLIAMAKIIEKPSRRYMTDEELMSEGELKDTPREEEVMDKGVIIAEKCDMPYPQLMRPLMMGTIDLVLKAELKVVHEIREIEHGPDTAVGFSQTIKKTQDSTFTTGAKGWTA